LINTALMSQDTKGTPHSASRRVLFAFIAALALVLITFAAWKWFSAGADDYKVAGVPFRQWLGEHPDFEVQQGLTALGTNALPHLTRIVRRPPESPWVYGLKQKIWNMLPVLLQLHYPEWRPVPDWQLRRTALFALRFLGEQGKPALVAAIHAGRTETNLMVRAGGLVAALNIAPLAPETFALWLEEWNHTNHFSRRDLTLYLGMPQVPIPAAVPYLLKEIEDEHSEARINAMETLGWFGEFARPAVPHMIKLFSEPGAFRGNLLEVFARLGPVAIEAVPALVTCLNEQGPAMVTAYDAMSSSQVTNDVRPALTAGCLETLLAIGPGANNALPTIGPLLTNRDPTIRMLAAATQIKLGGPTEDALPILVAGAENRLPGKTETFIHLRTVQNMVTHGQQGAAFLLGTIGPPAKEGLPAVERLVTNGNIYIRMIAAQAIWRISGDASKALPVLLESVSAQNQGPEGPLLLAINAIGEMGPAASAAIPDLERLRFNSSRANQSVERALARIRAPQPQER
jgi:HEAT repeat protein